MKRLIATDYDGTLCRGGKIDPADRAAIDAWRAKGNYFGVVTGRGTDFFRTAEENGLTLDYFLLYNGALLALPDGTVVKEYLIGRSVFSALESFFRSFPDALYFDKASEREYYHQYYATFESPERACEVADRANALFGEEATAFVNGPHVNIGKKGSGKTQGVYDALEHFGLPADAAAVFGDDFNDLDMILTHKGWAIHSGRPEVASRAPHVCDRIADAVAEFLK